MDDPASYSLLYPETDDGLSVAASDRWPSPDAAGSNGRTDIYATSTHQPSPDHHAPAGTSSTSHGSHHSTQNLNRGENNVGSDHGSYGTDVRSASDSSYPGMHLAPMSPPHSRAGLVTSSFPHIEPSSGPERVLTRRPRAALVHRKAASPEFHRPANQDDPVRSPLGTFIQLLSLIPTS